MSLIQRSMIISIMFSIYVLFRTVWVDDGVRADEYILLMTLLVLLGYFTFPCSYFNVARSSGSLELEQPIAQV